jgi:Na+-translocating ferredoxin:NAD+ oxidoreductase RnfG subunit
MAIITAAIAAAGTIIVALIGWTATRRTSAAEQTAADRRADLQVLRATIQELRAENARERDDHAAEVAQLRARIATLEGR